MAEELKCQNCGKGFIPTCHITRQKFCSDECRIEWWREYHKANPPEDEPAKECAMCGAPLTGRHRGGRYCSRRCSVSARHTQQGVRRGKRRISAESLEEWKEKLTQATRAEGSGKRGKRVPLPLYRQEQELARIGIPVSRQTMANWIIAAHERWFSGFFQALRRELVSSEILHADEATLMVLREPGRKAQQKSYVWV